MGNPEPMKNGSHLFSLEAEMGCLCSMLTGTDSIRASIIDQVGETGVDWFHDALNANLYHTLVYNWRQQRSIKPELLIKQLTDSKRIWEVGGAARVLEVYGFIPSASAFQYYVDALRDKRWLRYVSRVYSDGLKMMEQDADDVQAVLNAAEEHLASITNRHMESSRRREIKQIVEDVLTGFDTPDRILGLSTGYRNLDEAIGGLAPGAKIVIAGQISGGKSSLAECIVNNVCVTANVPTAIFSFEMSDTQTVARLIQIRSEVSTGKLARGEGELWETKRYSNAATEVSAAPLHVINERMGLNGIRARIMQLKPRIICIDYLQICPEPKQKGENRTDQLDRMSAETKQLASQFGLTLIELSQLTATDKGPRTKGSSSITADCDVLAVIEDIDSAKDGYPNKNILIAKNRDGERGQHLPFVFKRNITKFCEK